MRFKVIFVEVNEWTTERSSRFVEAESFAQAIELAENKAAQYEKELCENGFKCTVSFEIEVAIRP